MANPLRQSIQAAERANDKLLTFFSKAGIDGHPRGYVTSAYRQAKAGMEQVFEDRSPVQSSREVLANLQYGLQGALVNSFRQAQDYGLETAGKMLAFYDPETPPPVYSVDLLSKVDKAVRAVLAKTEAQVLQVEAMMISGIEPELIIGTEDRAGVLKAGDVLAGVAFWTAELLWDAWTWAVTNYGKSRPFKKQAVATLDNKVTDCCLRVHGQIQDLDRPFQLTGEPRYADEMDGPPFHGYCRTSIVLYIASFDDGLTEQMQSGAETILDERSRGIRKERHPASALLS